MSRSYFVAATLARSGFSGERTYRVMLVGGMEYAGTAPIGQCRTSCLGPVSRDWPLESWRGAGYVEVIVSEDERWTPGESVAVRLPDGAFLMVRSADVQVFDLRPVHMGSLADVALAE